MMTRTPRLDDRDESAASPILPSQFFATLEQRRASTGAERLIAAMLEDAISIFCKYRANPSLKAQRTARDVERWLRSNDRAWVFSFLRICEALDVDAEYVRVGLGLREHNPGRTRFADICASLLQRRGAA